MLPELLPIFPLPNVVLFPNVFLPLHIFEPRYRQMVTDALETDRLIGMCLLQPGYDADYAGRPPVFPIGCAGVMTHADQLADGRYNIVLKGMQRFRVTGEVTGRAYRQARIEPLIESVSTPEGPTLASIRAKLESMLLPLIAHEPRRFPVAMSDEDLIHALAQYLELDPLERQALLERDSIADRGAGLVELLEMKLLAPKVPHAGRHVH